MNLKARSKRLTNCFVGGLCSLSLCASMLIFSGCGAPANPNGAAAPAGITQVYDEDARLAIDGTNEAIVLYFYSRYNEVCVAQEPVLARVAAQFGGRVKFVKLDYMSNSRSSTNTMHLTLYDVHHTPTIVLRRKGDTNYRKCIGLQSEEALIKFVSEGLEKSAD